MSLQEEVREYAVGMLESDELRVTSESVSDGFIRSKIESGEWMDVGPTQRSAEYGGVIQIVRPLLRTLVPEDPQPDDSQLAMELPEDKLLQNRYSVRGEGNDNYYVKREEMTEDEMMQVTNRFRKLSVHYDRHAKALESWWHREHTPEPMAA